MAQRSNIRVFVRFKDEAFFAGEDVECTITFENVQTKDEDRRKPRQTEANGYPSRRDSVASQIPQPPKQITPSRRAPAAGNADKRLRQTSVEGSKSSLNVVDDANKQESSEGGVHIANSTRPHRHGRSVSIISLKGAHQRPRAKHGRSMTQQPSPTFALRRLSSLGLNRLSPTISTYPDASESPVSPTAKSSFARARLIPRSASQGTPRASDPSQPVFQFPPVEGNVDTNTYSSEQPNLIFDPDASVESRSHTYSQTSNSSVDATTGGDVRPQFARAFSVQSLDETPRPSVDIYSHKNDSNETLMSDYPWQATTRLLRRPLLRGMAQSKPSLPPPRPTTETLMMGYVQIFGSFVLDESLVNSSPFEEVKRRAVVGGQGGGSVVGLGSTNGDESFMSAFSWGSITGSIGDILSSSEPSSIRQMKDMAESKNIPLLSTQKSILFVNMKLEPGESRSFNYKFPLPRGLPPSHKGRAMKMTYNLVVATQRPSPRQVTQQNITQVDVPFRVFSGVNDRGESLGHDLIAPYIIVEDRAEVEASEEHANSVVYDITDGSALTASSAPDFESYVVDLLSKTRKDSTASLWSPTSELQTNTPGIVPYTPALINPSARNLIDQAVRQTSVAARASQTPTIFTIARASIPIATLSLSRSVVKLGDLLFVVIDFSNSKLPCYAVEATLESSESVDPMLAIRSKQSVERVTRRVWARSVENAVCARRCVFKSQIPVLATPGFATSGVSLDWCVRVELVVSPPGSLNEAVAQKAGSEQEAENDNDGAETDDAPTPTIEADNSMLHKAERLLEVVKTDERGTILSAAQWLPCESFEVTIPLRVFGAAVGGGENGTGLEGLPI